jgi:hypothetical protein
MNVERHNRKNNDRLEEISHRSTFVLYPKMPRANAPVNINAGSAQNVTGPEREHQWPAETVLSEGHQLVGALANPSEQSGASAQRTAT